MKSRKQILLTVCVFLLVLLSATPIVAENDKKVVRVAYFVMGDYYKKTSSGTVSGYDSEILAKVANYTDLEFEYVDCGTWKNALAMLNNKQVDLVGTAQWTPQREQEYEYCLNSYGYTIGELACLPERNFIYEDYTAFDSAIIGCTVDYVRRDDLNNLLAAHNLSPTIKTYATQEDLELALNHGEIDIIAANSHTMKSDWQIVEKFSYSPFFFISWKGNTQLTNQLDDALITLKLLEPTADDQLLEAYFPSIIDTPLTKQELDLINQNKTYDVYLNTATKPTSWYDEKTGELKGSLVNVCAQIYQTTGLKLNPVPQTTELGDDVIKTTTILTNVPHNNENGLVTNSLLNENFNFYYCNNQKLDLLNDTYTVGIVKGRASLIQYINENYPNASLQFFDTPLDCLRNVENGTIDLTFLAVRIADNAIFENGLNNIRQFPIEPVHQGIALTVPGEDAELLVSIINKGVEQVNQDQINSLYTQYAFDTREPITVKTIIRDYLIWIILIVVVIVILVVILAVSLTYAKVMKKQNEEVKKANEAKSEFFSRMSHDMRTPMNGILGMIRLSKETNNLEDIRNNLNKAESSGDYMLSLINDTLDLQKLESKKLKLQENIVYVQDYYDSIFSVLKLAAQKKKQTFRVKYTDIVLDNYILIDAVRTKQILSNLISNAIKFTPEGGVVEVQVIAQGNDGDVLHRKFVVSDTGVGMSEQFIKDRLFQPYAQENNELTSQLTGTGLGMAITKNLVETMGGRIEVESTVGEGTTYTVYLDIRQASKESVEKARKEREAHSQAIILDLKDKQILICEDHPLNAEITQRILTNIGCKTQWAKNGKEGVSIFQNSTPNFFDVILMDIRMPIMNGLDATKEIRSLNREDAKTIPIIALTANAYESDIKSCLEAGMNTHLTKPIIPDDLYNEIAKQLQKKN